MHADNIAKFIDELIEHEENFDWKFFTWLRSAFTTLCLMEHIDSDTKICDALMIEMYEDIGEHILAECDFKDFDEFYNYMVEDII